jgi:hypothetical protein
VPAPDGYFEALPARVRARLQEQARPQTFRLPVWTWAVAAALLVAVVTPFIGPTPPASRAPEAPPPVEYPAPAAGAPPAAALGDSSDREGQVASRKLATPKDETTKLRKQAAAEERADRPETAAEAARPAPKKESFEQKADLEDAYGERERSEESAASRKRANAGGPSMQQQVPLQGSPAPAYAPPPVAAPATESVEALNSSRDERLAEDKAPRGAALGRTARAMPLAEERIYEGLLAPPARTLAALRARREAWRSFSLEFPTSPRADEARVRAIENGAEAWRLGADPADLTRVREDATAYLARADATQGARVRALLESLATGMP